MLNAFTFLEFSRGGFALLTAIAVLILALLFVMRSKSALKVFLAGGSIVCLLSLVFFNSYVFVLEPQGIPAKIWIYVVYFFMVPAMLLSTFYASSVAFFAKLSREEREQLSNGKNTKKRTAMAIYIMVLVGLPFSTFAWNVASPFVKFKVVLDGVTPVFVIQLIVWVLCAIFYLLAGFKRFFLVLTLQGLLFGLIISGQASAYMVSVPFIVEETLLILNYMLFPCVLFSITGLVFIAKSEFDFVAFGDKPPLPSYVMNFRIQFAAAMALKNALGWSNTLSLLPKLSKAQKNGEPWKELPAPASQKDKDSRALIGDAIIVYRLLLQRMEQEKAVEIVENMVKVAAIQQLYALIPQFSRSTLVAIPEEKRELVLSSVVEKFPNSDWYVLEVNESHLTYRITRCRLVELVNELGHPELSGVFCPGDITYFNEYQDYIILVRPCTIGEGVEDHCDFKFSLDLKSHSNNDKN